MLILEDLESALPLFPTAIQQQVLSDDVFKIFSAMLYVHGLWRKWKWWLCWT